MQTFTLGAPNCGFILSEANGHRSRENGIVASGQNVLRAGTVVMDNGSGKLIAYTAEEVTAGGSNEAAGIIMYEVDATSEDVAVAYIARDAEVILSALTYPEATTDNPIAEANTIASLALRNIIARD